MSDDLADRLNERRRSEEYATTWRPEEHGTTLIGTLEAMDAGKTEYGECEIAQLRGEDGQLWGVWLFHTVLENEWAEADPTPGDRVGIVYLGERDGKTHSYHAYAVEVDSGAPAGSDAADTDTVETEDLNGKEQAEKLYGEGEKQPAGPDGGEEHEFVPDDSLPF